VKSTILKSRHRNNLLRVAACFTLALLALCQSANALTRIWANAGSDYNTGANWGGTAPGAGDIASFNTAASVQPNISVSLSNLTLNFAAGSSGYDLTSSSTAVKLTLLQTGAGGSVTTAAIFDANTSGTNTIDAPIVMGGGTGLTQTINQSTSGGNLTINGVISSTNSINLSLTMTGTSTITLSGANTYTGTTALAGNTIGAGTILAIGNNSAFSSTTVSLNSGIVLTAANGSRNIANTFIWGASGSIGGTNNLEFSGSFTSSGAAGRTITINNSGTTTLSGNVFLAPDNAAVGGLTINGTGALVISGVIANNSAANTNAKNLTVNMSTGSLTLSNANTYTGSTTLSSGTLILGNKQAFGIGGTVAWNGVSTSATTSLTGANAIANTGTFGGTNTFTGTNSIELSGALSQNASRTTTNNMTGGAVLTYSGATFALSTTATANTHNFNGSGNTVVSNIISNGGTATTGNITQSGTGSLTLSGANTYAGKTTISNGTLSASSINSVTGGAANSNLGAPITVANGTIDMGGTTNTGTLKYTGSGETTDRVINLAGSTGGATIDQSGTGLLKFTSNLTAPGLAATDERKTLTLQGSTAGTGEISGIIVDSTLGTAGQLATSVTKAGTGTWTLSGANTYTGTTTINASGGTLEVANNGATTSGRIGSTATITVNSGGTLLLSGAGNNDRINNSAGIALSGGTLSKGTGSSEGTGAQKVAGVVTGTSAVGLGALTLAANSTIDFGTGTVGTLTFASFTPAGFVLNITNWTGTASGLDTTNSGIDGVNDRLIFNADQTANLAFFSFNGIGAAEIALDGGFFEVVPIPETSTWIIGALALGAVGFTQRRKLRGLIAQRA
jgi:autotransporter-associated beta strand protein